MSRDSKSRRSKDTATVGKRVTEILIIEKLHRGAGARGGNPAILVLGTSAGCTYGGADEPGGALV